MKESDKKIAEHFAKARKIRIETKSAETPAASPSDDEREVMDIESIAGEFNAAAAGRGAGIEDFKSKAPMRKKSLLERLFD